MSLKSTKSWAAYGLFLALINLSSTPIIGQKDAAAEPTREETPRFAVSSIKLSRPDAQMRDMRISFSGPNLQAVSCTVGELLLATFGSSYLNKKLEGGPGWVRDRRFDIRANSEDGTSPSNLVLTQMTLQLLRDRFKLAWHIDSREVRGLALTVGKKQPDLFPSKDGERREVTWGTSVDFKKIGMAEFARTLSGSLNTTIVDRTDLKGEFDFTLRPDDYRSPDGDVTLADRLRSSVEGLGFKFVDEKVKVDYLTIDHAELPDDN
jgi:uncharacterized protein (TIGR03435 family)